VKQVSTTASQNKRQNRPKSADGHRARKRFGQNFLHDTGIIRRIIAAIHPQATDNMVEIGPGKGALTSLLLERLDQLQVVELDRDLIPLLEQQFPNPEKLIIHQADALKFDFQTLGTVDKPLRIVGNLPYNISTPLLFHLLHYHELIKDMHFMLQLEVVKRLAAQPGNKNYGRLSAMTQYFCDVEHLFDVPPEAFNPAPKVTSAIVCLRPRPPRIVAKNLQTLEDVLRNAFNQRRKTLRNTLKNLFDSEQLDALATDINIDLSQRPEKLGIDDFVMISNALAS
jgi:16S rRNA (adenine1518-N6/adenine1519-N6)-dimethyltransferase